MRYLLAVVAVLFFAQTALSNVVFFENSRTKAMTFYQTDVGTTAAAAIPAASVSGNLMVWKICNHFDNTSTYLYVGLAADPATDGMKLNKGECMVCENCKSNTLSALIVKAQAASNTYSVVQQRN